MYGRTAQGTPFRLPRNDPIPQYPCGEWLSQSALPAGVFCETMWPRQIARGAVDGREDGPHGVLKTLENRFDSGARLPHLWGPARLVTRPYQPSCPGSIPGRSTCMVQTHRNRRHRDFVNLCIDTSADCVYNEIDKQNPSRGCNRGWGDGFRQVRPNASLATAF